MDAARAALQHLADIVKYLSRLSTKLASKLTVQDIVTAMQLQCGVTDQGTQGDAANAWSIVRDVWIHHLDIVHRGLIQAAAEVDALGQTADENKQKSTMKHQVPRDLLSLRDYATVQAAVEIVVCWGFYPCFDGGINVPITKRPMPKSLKGNATIHIVHI